jgi:hypothetical protein
MRYGLAAFIVFSVISCFSETTDAAPTTAHDVGCDRQAKELGMAGAAASAYVQRCLSRQPAPNPPPRTAARNASCNRAATELGATGTAKSIYVQRCMNGHP